MQALESTAALPTAQNPLQNIVVDFDADSEKVPLAVDKLRDFLKNPGSVAGVSVGCAETKQRRFELYIETAGDGTLRSRGVKDTMTLLIMSSTKRGKTDSRKANYPIKMELPPGGDAVRPSSSETQGPATIPEALFLGKVRTLQRGKTYSLFDAGKNAHGSSTQHSKRLSAIKTEDRSQLASAEAAAAEFGEDRAELATVRGTRTAGCVDLEVLIATGDTVFRPLSKSAKAAPAETAGCQRNGGSNSTNNTTIVNVPLLSMVSNL